MFHILFTIFKLNDNVHTLKDTACQSWLYYIGLKRGGEACITNWLHALFP